MWALASLLMIAVLLSSPGIAGDILTNETDSADAKDLKESKAVIPSYINDMLHESIGHAEDVLAVLLGQFYPTRQEFLLGTPSLGNLITGRLKVLTNPAYWKNYLHEALIEGVFVIPKPVDVVKPEVLLPTAAVKAGDNIAPLPEDYVDLGNVSYEWKGREKTVKEFVITTETDCLVFIHNGKLVYENYANGWSPDMLNQPWSVTKSITSAMVGIAWGEGKIDSVHDPVTKYIEDLAGTEWEGSSIENLLQMESGIFWDEEFPVLAFNSQVQQWMSMFLDFFTGGLMGTTRNEFFKTMDRVNEPGEVFMYNSADTQVLAWLVETVYDTTFAEAVSEKLWKPGGMEGDALILTDREGSAIASQSFFAKPYDLARFGEIFLNNGKSFDNKQIVPAEWVEMSAEFTENSDGSYGYQWWNGSSNDLHVFQASGFQGNKVSVCPEANLTGVRLSHHLGANLRPHGDNPAGLSTYGFEIEMGGEEWTTAFTAVAKELEARDKTESCPATN